MVGVQDHGDLQPGLEIVQQRNGDYAPEVALPDHGWIYPVHDANEQQKVLPGGIIQQRLLQQTGQEQHYAQDFNAKHPSLQGNHFLTTPEVVNHGVPEAAPEIAPISAMGSVGRSEYGGYQGPSGEVSTNSPPRKRSRRKIIILAIVVVVIIIGAVVGGVVVGLRSRNSG
ncbi:hypothetical protein PG996_001538 [Apiospora saccharicola]|uniref:Uncharacterized protein n=1 Tax=Apiospora saccharicola TaxID=335842 RepID=A0ABR1WGY1_9PEZI